MMVNDSGDAPTQERRFAIGKRAQGVIPVCELRYTENSVKG